MKPFEGNVDPEVVSAGNECQSGELPSIENCVSTLIMQIRLRPILPALNRYAESNVENLTSKVCNGDGA